MSHPLQWTTLVPLQQPTLPAFDALSAWHREHFPQAPPLAAAASTENLLTLTIGGSTAAVALIPRPIPAGQLEGPAATAWYWPNAADALRDHGAHVIVTLVDEGAGAIAHALELSRLTAAVAATVQSVGVFWGPGRLVHPPIAFIEQVADASTANLPLFLWVDFRVEPLEASASSGALRLFTTGLAALGAQELEIAHFVGEPRQLVGFAYNVAHYLIDRRKVINDGDTIGLTDEVQVTVRRGPSMLGEQMEVMKLEFEDAAPAAGGVAGDGPAR